MNALRSWTKRHAELWQFVLFNVLSNISTIARFVFAWLGTALFVGALGLTAPFRFLFFDYTEASTNGLGGFLTFLVAEVVAQAVNFYVQKRWVFKSKAGFEQAAAKFAAMAVLIVCVNLVLPGKVVSLCLGGGLGAGVSATIASAVNTLLAVIVSYPLLKFWIMPPDDGARAGA